MVYTDKNVSLSAEVLNDLRKIEELTGGEAYIGGVTYKKDVGNVIAFWVALKDDLPALQIEVPAAYPIHYDGLYDALEKGYKALTAKPEPKKPAPKAEV